VPWEPRREGLLGIVTLYERLFAPTCTDYLGHIDCGPEPPDPLTSICYMWWDLFPTWGARGDEEPRPAATGRRARKQRRRDRITRHTEAALPSTVDDALLSVMSQTVRLDSEPCREGALHGLGHWHRAHPKRTTAIIDEWLAGEPSISADLRRYALSARTGCVL
jgi:hypothetical protein